MKVKLDRYKADNGAVHTFGRENIPGATNDQPSKEISGYTTMLLHRPQSKQTTSGNSKSLMASFEDTSKV